MKIISIDEIIDRINKKFPNQPFEILEYSKVSKPFTIKCLKCGEIKTYFNFNNFINANKNGICYCYNNNNKKTLHEINKEKALEIIKINNNMEFVKFWYKHETKKYMIKVKCLHCNLNFDKPVTDFIKNFNCPYCIGREIMNTEGFKSLLSEEYELLSEYVNTETKVTIKHKPCGFIWKVRPHGFHNYIGCPHCNKKKSKGEQKIILYLLNHNIQFENEKRFKWQSNPLRRYDFYIPEYNLICEYNGEQHYLENSYFKVPYKEQIIIDKEKELEALKEGYNYLVIGYFDYKNIEYILENWFNDYSARK